VAGKIKGVEVRVEVDFCGGSGGAEGESVLLEGREAGGVGD